MNRKRNHEDRDDREALASLGEHLMNHEETEFADEVFLGMLGTLDDKATERELAERHRQRQNFFSL